MNLQMDRIQQACETLKLNAVALEWSALADKASGNEFCAVNVHRRIDTDREFKNGYAHLEPSRQNQALGNNQRSADNQS